MTEPEFVLYQVVQYRATGNRGMVVSVNYDTRLLTVRSGVGGVQSVATGKFEEFEPVLVGTD